MRLLFISLLLIIGLAGELTIAQSTERSRWLPESWRMQKNLNVLNQEMNTIQSSMSRLSNTSQTLQQILFSLKQDSDTLHLSQTNKDLSENLNKFLIEVVSLIQEYQQLAQRQKSMEPFLIQVFHKLKVQMEQNTTHIIQLRQECVQLQTKGIDILRDYRCTKNLRTRNSLRQLYLLDQSNLKAKQFILQKQQQNQEKLQQFFIQIQDIKLVSEQTKGSLTQLIQMLQAEKKYILDLASFQIDVLQNSFLVEKIHKNQKKIDQLEKELTENLDNYSKTRDHLEERMFQIRQSQLQEELKQQDQFLKVQKELKLPKTTFSFSTPK